MWPPEESPKSPMVMGLNLSNVIKVADEMDKVDKRLADIIDEFIRDSLDNSEHTTFPDTSIMIREENSED